MVTSSFEQVMVLLLGNEMLKAAAVAVRFFRGLEYLFHHGFRKCSGFAADTSISIGDDHVFPLSISTIKAFIWILARLGVCHIVETLHRGCSTVGFSSRSMQIELRSTDTRCSTSILIFSRYL
jgi:hypothetical protein